MPDVFISYSRRDRDFVLRLNEGLEARGKDAWVDVDDIPASAEWLREIHEGIDASDAVLFVLSPDSAVSRECARELDHALERRKRILPIVHRDIDPSEVRPELAAINWVYLRDHDPFEQGLEIVVNALDTDLDHVKAHTRLANQAIHWDRAGRDRARLLRGSELQDAERWLTEAAAKEPGPTELQAQFVQASRDAARRRGRMLFAGVGVALVVAVALAIVALIQRSNAIHQSQVAYSRQLDAEAQNQYSSDPELSVLLALQAAHVAPSPATREALRQALGQSAVRQRYTNRHGPMGDAVWNPRSDQLLIAEEGADQAQIVRPGTHAKPIVLHAPGLDSQLGWDGSGRLAMTGGAETQIWNGATGRLVRRLPTRSLDAELSPDGRTAATTDLHSRLHLWDVRTGRQLWVASPASPGAPGCLVWSPEGSELLECNLAVGLRTAERGGGIAETATVFSAAGRRLAAIREPVAIAQAAFSPDSRQLALALEVNIGSSSPGTVVLNARTGARQIGLPGGSATAVAFGPDGKELAYSTIQGNIAYVYSFTDHHSVPLVGNTGTIESLHFSHTGAYVITSSGNDDTARIFDAFSGTPLEELAGHRGEVTDASFNFDDSLVATASKDGTARVWTTPAPEAQAHHLLVDNLYRVGISPDGRTALVAGPASPFALLLDARTLSSRATLRPPAGQLFGGGAFSPDGRWMALLSGRPVGGGRLSPGQLALYEAGDGKLVSTLAPADSPVQNAALDGSGQVATIQADGQVALWSAATGRQLRVLLPSGKPGESIVYSADRAKLAITHPDGSIDVVSVTGRGLHTLHGPAPTELVPGVQATSAPVRAAFSPDGRWLVSIGADDKVHVWDLASGRQVRTLTAGPTPLVSAAFSPDGRMVAAGDSATAYLWHFPSGLPGPTLQHASSSQWGFAAELNPIGGVRVAFSRDGATVTTSGDEATRTWDVQTGQSLLDVPFSLGGAATPDAQRVIAAASGLLGVFSCDLCGGMNHLLATARHDLTRGITPAERALYLRRN